MQFMQIHVFSETAFKNQLPDLTTILLFMTLKYLSTLQLNPNYSVCIKLVEHSQTYLQFLLII